MGFQALAKQTPCNKTCQAGFRVDRALGLGRVAR
jgi:hypothetical protein